MTRRIASSLAQTLLVVGALGAGAPVFAQSFGQQVGKQFQDGTLVTRVATKVQFNRALLMEKIDIAASDGIVTLSGKVSNQSAIDTAVKLASEVSGVKRVVNQMTVGRRDPDNAVPVSP